MLWELSKNNFKKDHYPWEKIGKMTTKVFTKEKKTTLSSLSRRPFLKGASFV
jgi:hypothetical protein